MRVLLLFLVIITTITIQPVKAGWWDEFPGVDNLIATIIDKIEDAFSSLFEDFLDTLGDWIEDATSHVVDTFYMPSLGPLAPVVLIAGAGTALFIIVLALKRLFELL